MTSTLAWLDYSEHDRQKMHELMERLGEKETRDELGIGSVRDTFADMLFPGTSTIQTRVRYFFFVPWIYLEMEARASPQNIGKAVRDRELGLVHALMKGGEKLGVIGSEAKDKLKRFPSSIYWQGLERWGFRILPWSQDQYHRWLARNVPLASRVRRAEDESIFRARRCWRDTIPRPPTGMSDRATFHLTLQESQYLRERILSSASASLLAELVVRGSLPQDAEFVWTLGLELSERHREQVEHARNFSEAMLGAALLYNLMLAEKAQNSQLVEEYRQRLATWGGLISSRRDAFDRWSLDRFWQIVLTANPRVTSWTQIFIATWLQWAIEPWGAQRISFNEEARALILTRERQLKKGLARMDNPRALELWNGAAGSSPLDYRWSVARRHLVDIIEGARIGNA